MKIKIGTRGSKLALVQANQVKMHLANFETEICTIETKGDLVLDRALHKVGDKGLFTAELEIALREGSIDIAVHSLKDLPTELLPGLPIAAITKREEPWDCLVFSPEFREASDLQKLPSGAVVGTSSLRRVAQLKLLRPDLQFIPLRGNVESRLKKIKMRQDGLAAGVLALAGLKRLDLEAAVGQVLGPELCLPAPGQGALGIQVSENTLARKAELQSALKTLHDPETASLVSAERAALRAVDGGCQTPFGALAEHFGANQLRIRAFVSDTNYQRSLQAEISGPVADGLELGRRLGERLKAFLRS